MKVRFGEEHLRRFSEASMDLNPAHLSLDYARRTSVGEPVVFGMLAFLACLREISPPAGSIPSLVRIDFKNPMVLDVDYTRTVHSETPDATRIDLLDGSVTMMHARVEFRQGVPEQADPPENGLAPRWRSQRLTEADLESAPSYHGTYSPGRSAYLDLLALLGIDRRVWGDALPLAILCGSYLSGMELPGESGTLSGLRLKLQEERPKTPLDFDVELRTFDARFGLAQSRFLLGSEPSVWATGELSAFVRQVRSESSISSPLRGSGLFTGKTALIIGASRGLGAAMALDLVAEGGTVVGVYARNQENANKLRDTAAGLPGRLVLQQGDASDVGLCIALKNRLASEFGKLDLLVCSAAPALQSLRVEEAYYARIHKYITQGLALALAPLCSFLDLVTVSKGCVLMISSAAVEDPPQVWPHYVALKSAVEGTVRTAALAAPDVTFWISRPGSISTDLRDTPMARLEAEPPHLVARRILKSVLGPAAPGRVRYCR